MSNPRYNRALQPLIYALLLAAGVYIGTKMVPAISGGESKIDELRYMLENNYVDTVNQEDLEEHAILTMLKDLDPHSDYIPKRDLIAVSEGLDGSFDGIGVQFNIHNDTILVVSVINGGPSEKVGLRDGDKIITVEGENVAGTGITNTDVLKLLKGPKGTKVKVGILRKGNTKLIDFVITRDQIPLYSVDASYMLTKEVGYIKLSRFSATSYNEVKQALVKLKREGLKSLIFDLRDNGGGYLDIAHRLADEFLSGKKLIVYTEGIHESRKDYNAGRKGMFEEGKLIVLVNESSASASEILSGAIQDWDRGVLIGRRTFGKGLVQRQMEMRDGSQLRLTTARYYIPSGRCIQKPYDEGYDSYNGEIMDRYKAGELTGADTTNFPDSLKYRTRVKGRVVYGGGGIMPDIFIPLDTTSVSGFRLEVYSKGYLNDFVYDYLEGNRAALKRYTTIEGFDKQFNVSDAMYMALVAHAKKDGSTATEQDINAAKNELKDDLKARLAQILFDDEGFYYIRNRRDEMIKKALEVLGDDTKYLSGIN